MKFWCELRKDWTLVLILLAGCLLAVTFGHAADNSITVSPPTTRVDGSALPAAQIAGYEISCKSFIPPAGVAGACPAGAPVTFLTGVTGTYTLTIPNTGGSVCLQGRTKTTDGLFSDYAQANTCKTFPPNPANTGSYTVAVAIDVAVTPVYRLTALGKRMPEIAGFAAIGIPCQGNVLFYYRTKLFNSLALQPYRKIDVANVRWHAGVTQQGPVAAPCELRT